MSKKVTVIIPCRNEERHIGNVLQNIINQDYSKDNIEVFIVDGMSDDKTRDIIKPYQSQYPFIKILDNPFKTVPYGMNIAIKESKGEIILRMDAHSLYPNDYISKLIEGLYAFNADNIGGVLITKPSFETLKARAIAIGLSNSFGVGNSYFRIGAKQPKEVDTVPFGCYKKEVFDKIGLFDEDLVRNQDDELNARLIKNGGKIFILPDIKIIYFARDKLTKVWLMYYQYGLFKPLVNIKIGEITTVRQLIPPAFVFLLFITPILSISYPTISSIMIFFIFLYILFNVYVSTRISIRHKEWKFMYILPLTFAIIHISYGCGYIIGMLKFWLMKKYTKRDNY